MTTTTNIYRVISVDVERIEFDSFHSLRFKFTTDDGATVDIDAFSAEPLALRDSPVRRVTQPVTNKVEA